MLDAHPDMVFLPETRFIPRVAEQVRSAVDQRSNFVEAMRSHPRWPMFELDADEFAARVAAIEPFELGAAFRVFYAMYAQRVGKPRYGDKSPPYTINMGLLQDLFPEARFVHLIRDGRDLALSILALPSRNEHNFGGLHSLQDVAQWWMMQMWRARGQVNDLRWYLEIRYEDLVVNPEVTLRQVCQFIGLPWDSSVLRYYEKFDNHLAEFGRGGRSGDQIAQDDASGRLRPNHLLTRPPQTHRIAVWRREMSPEDAAMFDDYAGEALREYGYPLARDGQPDALDLASAT
jgi:hypothetical protein